MIVQVTMIQGERRQTIEIRRVSSEDTFQGWEYQVSIEGIVAAKEVTFEDAMKAAQRVVTTEYALNREYWS